MSFDQQANQEIYQLIVTRRNASEMLLRSGSSSSLPHVTILRGERIAEQLTAELYAQCGCRSYCLFVLAHAAQFPRCAVMEAPDLDEPAPAGTCWKPFNTAMRSAVESAGDRTVIERSLEELDFYRREPNAAPFAQPGWLPELFARAELPASTRQASTQCLTSMIPNRTGMSVPSFPRSSDSEVEPDCTLTSLKNMAGRPTPKRDRSGSYPPRRVNLHQPRRS